MSTILLVDDEPSIREVTQMMLSRDGYLVTVASTGEEAVEYMEHAGEDSYDLVLTDLKMKGVDGLGVLDAAKRFDPSTQVVMMTAYASAETAVQAMKAGAFHYLEKPFKKDKLLVLMAKALDTRRLMRENVLLKRAIASRSRLGEMIGHSTAMRRLYDMVKRVAPAKTTVLITGESGTGKELVARAIHQNSPRSERRFVPINCGAIPEQLIESELFGHVKGAFTGAHKDKAGLFSAAQGGTVFLDEVGDLPLPTQVKLLRALQERRVQPVGSVDEHEVDVRVVAATNKDLLKAVQEGAFREDLYYRLNVIQLAIPPLRERQEDIPLLVQHFLQRFAEEQQKSIQGVERDAMARLLDYPYPGNVRELMNVMERVVTLETKSMISTDVLPAHMIDEGARAARAAAIDLPEEGIDLEGTVEQLERRLLAQALQRTQGNKTEAARLLGITFRSIRYRLRKYGMDDESEG